jgi:hypothetical protein
MAALLFVGAAALSAVTALRGLNFHDEGLMLQAAARMADGELPWRDFWWNYGPAQPLILAAPDAVFGPSLLPWRVLRVLLDAGVAVMAWALVRREAGEPAALAAWLAVAGAMAFPKLPSPVPALVALAFGAALLAPRSALAAGALGGAALAFRPDLGLAVAAGAVIGAAAAAPHAGRIQAAGRAAAAAALAGLVLLGPFVILGGPGEFWDDTFGFLIDEQGLQRLPLPGRFPGDFDLNKLLEFYFPYALLGGAALWAASALHRRPPAAELALAPLALAGILYLLARTDEYHLLPAAAVLPVLLAGAADRELRAGSRVPAAVLGVALGLLVLHGLDRRVVPLVHPPQLERLQLDAADGVRTEPREAQALERLVADVRARVPAGAPIFVANPRHDLVRVGAPLVYVLADRPNPTRYDVMQPGVVTTEPVQREIVRDLRRSDTRVVVRWLSPVADQREPNGSGRSSGVHVLDEELRQRFRPAARFGDFQVLTRYARPDR